MQKVAQGRRFDSQVHQSWGGGVGCNPKNRKNPKKTVPNLKFAVALGFFGFFSVFFVFFGLNFDEKLQPFKNHVNNKVLRGQELLSNISNVYRALQESNKSYFNQQEPRNP